MPARFGSTRRFFCRLPDSILMLISRIKRVLQKPPKVVIARILMEVRSYLDLFFGPRRGRSFRVPQLLKALKAADLDSLWKELQQRPHVCIMPQPSSIGTIERQRILEQASLALSRKVDLLGSGITQLSSPVRWNVDLKSGFDWPFVYSRHLEYSNLERPSDVKFPWELSRLQWMIPVGQAYWLTGDEKYADFAQTILQEWILGNPYCLGPNWACTMEVAIRICVWSWFFLVFSGSRAWSEQTFRGHFLCSLYLHAEFTAKYLELSDVNGNHYTADLAGLVFAGLFFGRGPAPKRWFDLGWRELENEITKQTYVDGVNHEASIPYHRLVTELFLFPALYCQRFGRPVSDNYKNLLRKMSDFACSYTHPDGSVPVWGDADDARLLPFGSQSINDHRYLTELVSSGVGSDTWLSSGSSEHDWVFGCPASPSPVTYLPHSRAFPAGGFYVLANHQDHVLVDCGPVGLQGRGGHGHNDCLSFEAWLNGCKLFIDCGCYVYTASATERNAFRSTAYHNTPQLDSLEINRFRSDSLWFLIYDAVPGKVDFSQDGEVVRFHGSHVGHAYAAAGASVFREIQLNQGTHTLVVCDRFSGMRDRTIKVPYHLAPDWALSNQPGALPLDTQRARERLRGTKTETAPSDPAAARPLASVILENPVLGRQATLTFSADWQVVQEPSWYAPSYGCRIETNRLVFSKLQLENDVLEVRVSVSPETA
jgi:hypothetical protein